MSRLSRILAAGTLDELYALVPSPVNCTGECADSCGPIGYSEQEGERLQAAGHRPPNTHEPRTQFMCSALTEAGKCSVYEARPMICRLWGVSDALPCNHEGCFTPNPLSRTESVALLRRSMEIGGEPKGFREHYSRRTAALVATVRRARSQEGV